jgi:hypothetical protein
MAANNCTSIHGYAQGITKPELEFGWIESLVTDASLILDTADIIVGLKCDVAGNV